MLNLKRGKRILAILLAAGMVIGVIPYTPNTVIKAKAETEQKVKAKTIDTDITANAAKTNPYIMDISEAESDSGIVVTKNADGSVLIEYTSASDYAGVRYALPSDFDLSLYSSFEIDATVTEQFGFIILDESKNKIKEYYPGSGINSETRNSFTDTLTADTGKSLSDAKYIEIQTQDKNHTPITVYSIKFYTVEKTEGSLKESYQSYFKIGAAVNSRQLATEDVLENHIKHQYDSITLENEMKPDTILGSSFTYIHKDQAEFPVQNNYLESAAPKLNFDKLDACLQIAKENGLVVRGHTLIWHNQMPEWFFRENFRASGNIVSPEVMDARMEYLIQQVLLHVQKKYPGVVYAWDVVNEIFQDSSGTIRTAGSGSGKSLYTRLKYLHCDGFGTLNTNSNNTVLCMVFSVLKKVEQHFN